MVIMHPDKMTWNSKDTGIYIYIYIHVCVCMFYPKMVETQFLSISPWKLRHLVGFDHFNSHSSGEDISCICLRQENRTCVLLLF